MNDCRASLGDKVSPDGPEVAFVVKSFLLASDRERLAWATSGPERPIVRPSSKSSCKGPDADASEEMALCEASEIVWLHVNDGSLVNLAWRNVSSSNKVSQPLGGVGVDFVIVGPWHITPPPAERKKTTQHRPTHRRRPASRLL
jgi:hypothetical protein